ncbi:MAG TPA: hypothetical protein PKD09_11840 [Aggregatilinea sp.]|jgi:hypothetical protein|uniref:hypothetical protein n=1 Tax=Aggregatilinea sp. TaxID=2806333 RepID=UPI002B79AD85|nr:hypothetical protein [Aggregatilinea sp.]HML22333.1 hypothetical protein [Aggregatilinea sp.]
MVQPQPTASEFQRLVTECRRLPPAQGNYLVHDYVENLLLTVLDFQMTGTTVGRAMDYYWRHARIKISDFAALKKLLASCPDTKEGNLQIAQYLWGYNYWNRVELLRRLVTYFEIRGVTTQEQLQEWATKVDFEKDFEGKVKGAGFAIFKWLVMRQGVETIKPDMWIHRFIYDVLGYSVSDAIAVESLEKAARETGIKVYELDWRIWEYQRSRNK